VEPTQELLQKWDARARRPRMEVTDEGLTLGAGTVLARMAQDVGGRLRLALDDEPREMALLATAYWRSVDVRLLAKLRRAAELWNDGEKALAHIHLAHAGVPPCEEEQALRLFVADELIEAGVTPHALMKAPPLALLKFNPDQPRVPAGSGRESGEWTSGGAGDANITPVAFRSRREKGRHGRGGRFEWIDRFLELFREPRKEPAPEEKPPEPEVVKPESKPPETPKPRICSFRRSMRINCIISLTIHGMGSMVW
jgi:hypothetical protein